MCLKNKNLTIIAICEDECQLFNDDGIFINKGETKPISKLSELIKQANEIAEKNTTEKTTGLKTIITVPELNKPENLCLSNYAMHYITYEAIYEHWIHESEAFKSYIHKIQKGLF